MYLYSCIHKNNNLFKFIEDRRKKRERERGESTERKCYWNAQGLNTKW